MIDIVKKSKENQAIRDKKIKEIELKFNAFKKAIEWQNKHFWGIK